MYYLKSRYYDPEVCRFINADKFASTGQGIIGYNMFAYCLNNPVNRVDSTGNDAIWIQEEESAGGFGHSGLISQDENGDWYYFFWGPKYNILALRLKNGTTSAPVFYKLNTDGCDMTTTEGVIKAVDQTFKDDKTKNRSSLITDTYYFYGDYTKTTAKAKEISKNHARYNLIKNNCVQNTIAAFMESDIRFSVISYGDIRDAIPNEVYLNVLTLTQKKPGLTSR